MVYFDISQNQDDQELKKKSSAHLMDRFFSFVIDYLVISPFVLFLLYLTFGSEFTYWKRFNTTPEGYNFLTILSISYVTYFSLIQSFFIYIWRATPGQFFLKIQMEFQESDSLIFLRALSRQISFWFSFAVLGIPFIEMLTQKSRRTFYDRIGDVQVLSLKQEDNVFSFEKEYKYWQSFLATIVLFISFLASTLIWGQYKKVVSRQASYSSYEAQGYFCKELEGIKADERLQYAIGLNLVDQLSDDCLDREADFALWKEKKSSYSLAYYAKSLTTKTTEKESLYLQQACSGEDTNKFSSLTQGCKIAQSFLNDNMSDLYAGLNQNDFLSDLLRYELSIVLNKRDDVQLNFAKLEKHNGSKTVKKYQALEMISHRSSQLSKRLPAAVPKSLDSQTEKLIKLIGEM